jgi:cytochrome b6-f complex iron-sulfur subunit
MSNASRRDFLRLATTGLLSAAGLAGLGGLIRFLDFQSDPPRKTVVDLGETSQYAMGSQTLLPDIPAMLFAMPAGFRALSLICTHLGCTVEQADSGFKCPCHGSRYDAQGNVERGPARQPLHQLRVEISAEGHVLLHTD